LCAAPIRGKEDFGRKERRSPKQMISERQKLGERHSAWRKCKEKQKKSASRTFFKRMPGKKVLVFQERVAISAI
jgi:hypothetical protein